MRKPFDDRSIIHKAFMETNAFYKGKKDWVYPLTYKESVQIVEFYFRAMALHMHNRIERVFILPYLGYVYLNKYVADLQEEAKKKAALNGFTDSREDRNEYMRKKRQRYIAYLRKKYNNLEV